MERRSRHIDVATTASLLGATHPAINVATGIFVVGHVAGTTLLGIALLRSTTQPRWVGWSVAVSQPVHFIAFVLLGSPLLDLVGWSMLAVGLAGTARSLAREPHSIGQGALVTTSA